MDEYLTGPTPNVAAALLDSARGSAAIIIAPNPLIGSDPRQAAAADFSLRGQLRFRAQRRQLLIRGVERTHHAELNQHAI